LHRRHPLKAELAAVAVRRDPPRFDLGIQPGAGADLADRVHRFDGAELGLATARLEVLGDQLLRGQRQGGSNEHHSGEKNRENHERSMGHRAPPQFGLMKAGR